MRWTVLVILFFMVLVNFVDKSLFGLAADSMMNDLGITYGQLGIIGSSFYWIFPISAVLVGFVTDKLGSKKLIGYMLLAWTVLQMAGGFLISGFTTLFLYRFLLGFSEGGAAPATFRELFTWFPQELRGRVNAIINSGAFVGAFALTPILVILIQSIGWKYTFVIAGLASLVLYFVWTIFVTKATANVRSINHNLDAVPDKKFKWSEFYPILLTRTCLLTLLACFGFNFLLTWMSVWMPLYLINVVKLTPLEMGYATAIIGITSVTVGISLGIISDRIYKKTQSLRKSRVLVTGLGMSAGAIILISLYTIHSPAWTVIAFALASGLGQLIGSVSHIIMSHQLPERTATLSGVIIAVMNLAGIVSPILTGIIVGLTDKGNIVQGFNYSLLTVSIIVLITALLFMFFVKPDKPKKTEDENVIPDIPVFNEIESARD